MFYAYVNKESSQILGSGECPRIDDATISIAISEEVFNNIDCYIYKEGRIILDPEYEQKRAQKEKERIAKLSLTKREVFLALYKAKGLTPEMIRNQITDTEALIEFDYATEYFRFNPLIDKIGLMLGYSSDDIDYLFIHKELPAPDNVEGV